MELIESLTGGHHVASALIVISLVAITGLALGDIKIMGVKMGIAGALFTGIAFAHFGFKIDPEILEFVREFGLILFVYTIGLQVGPGFFASLKKEGLALNLMAASIVLLGVLIAVGVHFLGGVDLPAALGLYSGAVTNTPSLAAGQQVLMEVGAAPEQLATPGLGYAVAYPFGIVGILITMALLRRAFKLSPAAEAEAFDDERRAAFCPIETLNLEIRNPNLAGLTLRQMPGLASLGVVVSRMMHDGTQQVATPDQVISLGDVLLAVGPKAKLDELRLIVGGEASVDLKEEPSAVKWERVVVTNSAVLGKTIAEADFRHAHGVSISRLNRAGIELFPSAATRLQFGDILTIIGTPEQIKIVAGIVGNKPSLLQHAQIIPIFIGILLGVVIGSIPLHVPGMPAALKLGLAGGPLIVAILLSRLGHAGPLVWFMPPGTNLVVRELGIVLFLACVGIRSGGRFVETVLSEQGLQWLLLAALITIVPLLLVGFVARWFFKLNYLSACGLLAGSMTDPPALAFANAIHPSEAPALAYATVYPLVMFLRVLSPQIMVLLLWPT